MRADLLGITAAAAAVNNVNSDEHISFDLDH